MKIVDFFVFAWLRTAAKKRIKKIDKYLTISIINGIIVR